ncbi:MAG: hypothetical protein ACLQRM_10450, partial [Acidimicrobiales bacterium]
CPAMPVTPGRMDGVLYCLLGGSPAQERLGNLRRAAASATYSDSDSCSSKRLASWSAWLTISCAVLHRYRHAVADSPILPPIVS